MRFILMVIGILLMPQAVHAEELSVILNGKSIHLEGEGWNENNGGIGFEYDFKSETKWSYLVAGSTFKDSFNETSNYFGAGMKRRFLWDNDVNGLHLDAGVLAFFMTRKDYKNNNPFLGALPFVSIGTPAIALNMVYVPKVSPKSVPLLYFQLKIGLTSVK